MTILQDLFNPTELTILKEIGNKGGGISPYDFKRDKLGPSYAGVSRYCHILEENGYLIGVETEGARKSKRINYRLSSLGICVYLLILFDGADKNHTTYTMVLKTLSRFQDQLLEFRIFIDLIDNLTKDWLSEEDVTNMEEKFIDKTLLPECRNAVHYKGNPNFMMALLTEPLLPSFWSYTPFNEKYPQLFARIIDVIKKYPDLLTEVEIMNDMRDWNDIENEIFYESKMDEIFSKSKQYREESFTDFIKGICKKYLRGE